MKLLARVLSTSKNRGKVISLSTISLHDDEHDPDGKTWENAGGIALGVGGDNSNNSWGTFFEGAVTNGSPTNATDLAVMKNIQSVGYKK